MHPSCFANGMRMDNGNGGEIQMISRVKKNERKERTEK
jgi:hypothetical protein